MSEHLVSVVIPCLNEAETIRQCVERARAALDGSGLTGEVLVVDNGSADGSGELAREAGARVVEEPRRGYGQAYLTGFAEARGDYIVMVDADLTYDFGEIPRFVRELDDGAELAMGNRMHGIAPGAMPALSRIGNPLLSGFLNLIYRTGVSDVHCGMRAVRRDALPRLELRATGMEFASEMVIRGAKAGLVIRELPIELHPRGGESKLSPFRDGWRHLRLMLVHSPNALFLVPGTVMIVVGSLVALTVFAHVPVFGHQFFVHTLIVACGLVIVGLQVVGLGLCARAYGVFVLRDRDPWLERMQSRFRLEHGLALGAALLLVGLVLGGVMVGKWAARGFGTLSEERLAIVSVSFVIAGTQVFFTSFLLSIIGLKKDEAERL
jgi:glycosyltransferase involved in cell wall biosynthesis